MEPIDYRDLLEHAPDAIFVIDRSGIVIDANRQASRFLGYVREEMLGSPITRFVAPEQYTDASRRFERLVHGERVAPVRRVFLRADGTRVPGEIYAALTEAGPAISIVRDVTRIATRERGRAEQSLRLQALGTLASSVAHDFNNILASIIGFAELAREQIDPESDPARDLSRSLRAADQARKLVAQILAFGRQHEGEPRPVDVEQAIVQIIRLVRATLPAGIDLQFTSDHSPATVVGDQTRLQQIVLNLCANAGKAIGERGGTVAISLETVDLSDPGEWLLSPGAYVRLSVVDDGPGVPAEIRDWIFEPFFSTRGGTEGTGLGLSVVKSIVDDHGGAIRLEPGEGGAHFTIMLPAARSVAGEESPAEPASTPARGAGTVLVLDDEPEAVEIVSRTLGGAGYSVMGSTDPYDALQLVETWGSEIDLVITDQAMPSMEGTEFLSRLRRRGFASTAVMLTGARIDLDESALATLGVARLLRKPVHGADLIGAVGAIMRRAR